MRTSRRALFDQVGGKLDRHMAKADNKAIPHHLLSVTGRKPR